MERMEDELAGYVLKVGLEKGDKTPHELLIKPGEETSFVPQSSSAGSG